MLLLTPLFNQWGCKGMRIRAYAVQGGEGMHFSSRARTCPVGNGLTAAAHCKAVQPWAVDQ